MHGKVGELILLGSIYWPAMVTVNMKARGAQQCWTKMGVGTHSRPVGVALVWHLKEKMVMRSTVSEEQLSGIPLEFDG